MSEILRIIRGFARKENIIFAVRSSAPLSLPSDFDVSAPFVKYSREERINPRAAMPGCESLIFIGAGYKKERRYAADGLKRCRIAMSAVGVDYHKTVAGLLHALAGEIAVGFPLEYKAFADTGPLLERAFAEEAGLGYVGRSGSLISPEFGALFNIGYLMTNLKIEADTAGLADSCGDCRDCIDACPTGALSDAGFDYRRCVSYLTQRGGELTREERRAIGENLYGCDVCAAICPKSARHEGEAVSDPDAWEPQVSDILKMTRAEFKEKYGDSGIFWRGLDVIKRNGRAIYENQTKLYQSQQNSHQGRDDDPDA